MTCRAPQPIERAGLVLGDDELLDGLVEHDEVLAEQDPPLHVRLQQVSDAAHIGRPRRADPELTHGTTLRRTSRLTTKSGCRGIRSSSW